MRFWRWLKSWIWQDVLVEQDEPAQASGRIHLVILDGTRSSLLEGREGNAGLAYKMMKKHAGKELILHYQPGIQFSTDTWASMFDVLTGRGINNQIRVAYGALASRYRPGDKIYLLGFSRGAYAVRSLAGIIDRVGLLRRDCATYRSVRTAFRHYKTDPGTAAAKVFSETYCHPNTCITAIGVWDTVKALGVRLPVIWRAFDGQYKFHNHRIPACVQHGFHALALDETRSAYAPVMWQTRPDWTGDMRQMWFRGNHSDIGGMVVGDGPDARGLSNIPYVWMMRQMQDAGLPLGVDWEQDYVIVRDAQSSSNWQGVQRFFLARSRRLVGRDPSEDIHDTVVRRHHKNLSDFHNDAGG